MPNKNTIIRVLIIISILILLGIAGHFTRQEIRNNKSNKIQPSYVKLIDYKYDEMYHYQDNLLIVKSNNKWGIIDINDNIVLDIKYDNIIDFHGLAFVTYKKDGKSALIDSNGKLATDFIYSNINSLDIDVAHANQNRIYDEESISDDICGVLIATRDNRTVLIDDMGTEYKSNNYANIIVPSFTNSFAASGCYKGYIVVEKDGKKGLINKSGGLVINYIYDDIIINNDGTLSLEKNNKWGLVDKTGQILIPIKYDFIINKHREYPDSDKNVYFVTDSKSDKVGLINKKGNVIIPIKYNNYGYDETKTYKNIIIFSLGSPIYNNATVTYSSYYTYDYNGNLLFDKYVIPTESGNYINVDNGKVIVYNHNKNAIAELNNIDGIMETYQDDKYFIYKASNKYGMMDENGKIIIDPIYDNMNVYKTNKSYFFLAEKNSLYGVIDEKGKIIVSIKYSSIDSYGSYFKLSNLNVSGWSLVDSNNKKIISIGKEPDKYLKMFDNKYLTACDNDNNTSNCGLLEVLNK